MSNERYFLPPKTVLQNRYLILEVLGSGGMGAIYRALDERLGGDVALKESFHSHDQLLRKQFHREAQLLAHLRHPSLPKVFDHFMEHGRQFLVMEYIPGDDLARLLKLRAAGFPVAEVISWAAQLLRLLEHLHNHEPAIIHRDIKPANLKLTVQGTVVLLDFGLAKGTTGLTSTTLISFPGHTPSYAPLEQILNKGTDGRSDLYSLAVTLYELLLNRMPPNAIERLEAFSTGLPDPLQPAHEINSSVPLSVSNALIQAMTLFRDGRTATASAMLQSLSDVRVHSFDYSTNTITINSPFNGKALLRLRPVVQRSHLMGSWCVAYSPVGDLVATSGGDGLVILYDATNGKELHVLEGHSDGVASISFSPDGKIIATAGRDADESVRLWEIKNGRSIRTITKQHYYYGTNALCFSPDGKFLASLSNAGHGIELRELKNDRLIRTLEGDEHGVRCVAFSPKGSVIASGGQSSLRVWDLETGKELWLTKREQNHPIFAIAFSPDGAFVTSLESFEDRVRVWDSKNGREIKAMEKTNDLYLHSISFSPDGKKLAAGGGKGIASWRFADGKLLSVFDKEGNDQLCFSANGKRLLSTGGTRDAVLVIDSETGETVWEKEAHWSRIHSLSFSRDGEILAIGRYYRTAQVLKIEAEREIRVMSKTQLAVGSVAISPNGRILASNSGRDNTKAVCLWDIPSGEPLHILDGSHDRYAASADRADAVSFSPNGNLVASAYDENSVGIWEIDRGRLVHKLDGHTGGEVTCVVFSPDGTLIASAGRASNILLWELGSDKPPTVLRIDGYGIRTLNFSIDGTCVAHDGPHGVVYVNEIEDGEARLILNGHKDIVTSVTFSPDGQLLASSSEDHTVRLWETATGKCCGVLEGHLGGVNVTRFAPNGKYLVAAGEAGRLQFWDLKTQKTFLYRYDFGPDAWLYLLPDGRFDASPQGRRYLSYTELGALRSYSSEDLTDDFYDPTAVQEMFNRHVN